MKIFLMRHGHRADDPTNPAGVQMPPGRPLDPDISSIGIEQAKQSGDFLKDKSIKVIYASPFLRTTHTAVHIAEKLGLDIRLEWGLGEHFVPQWFSDWPGTLAPEELKRRFPAIDLYCFQTGVLAKTSETYWEMHDRSMKAVNALIQRHQGLEGSLLMVTHAAVACTVPPGLGGWDGWNARPHHCAISCVAQTENGWKIEYGARTDHMKIVSI